MSTKHLSLSAHALRRTGGTVDAWRYEERGGLTIVVGCPNSNETHQFRVSTRLMRAYLKRLDKRP